MLTTKEGKLKTASIKYLYKLVYNKVFCIDNITNLEGEEWREIKGTNGNYFVSNKGRIKSCCNYNAIIVKPSTNQKGYEKVQIFYSNNEKHNKYIHTLVAEEFEECGKKENDTFQVHHKDNNTYNNNASNLIWLSIEEHNKIHYGKKAENEN